VANDATAVRVAGNTQIYLAPVATAFPAWDVPIDGASGWVDIGYVTTDGVTWNFGRETTDIEAMQSADPIRTISTKLPKTLGFAIMQTGREQFAVALGGGTWTAEPLATGVFRYEPPEPSEFSERAAVVEMMDGDATYRWHIKRLVQKEAVEYKYTRDAAATLPVSLSILAAPDGSKPFYMLTDDPSVAP
jgi:hypothetical protein